MELMDPLLRIQIKLWKLCIHLTDSITPWPFSWDHTIHCTSYASSSKSSATSAAQAYILYDMIRSSSSSADKSSLKKTFYDIRRNWRLAIKLKHKKEIDVISWTERKSSENSFKSPRIFKASIYYCKYFNCICRVWTLRLNTACTKLYLYSGWLFKAASSNPNMDGCTEQAGCHTSVDSIVGPQE